MNPFEAGFRLPRRAVLQGFAAGALLPPFAKAAASDWTAGVLRYLERLARPDGGFAWEDQPVSHLATTFAAIGCYQLLGQAPPAPARHAAFVRNNHPTPWKPPSAEHRDATFQQIQTLLWLNEDPSEFAATVRGWKTPQPYQAAYEKHAYPIFRFQTVAFLCRQMLGLPLEELPAEAFDYLLSRRRSNGSFNNTPADDGSDGHLLNTLWGLEALSVAGRAGKLRTETAAWIGRCLRESGGFAWQPAPPYAIGEDLIYTWAAVRSLKLLEAEPEQPERIVGYLHSLFNENGGFSDRPGWLSNPIATYYALDALRALGALSAPPISRPKSVSRPKPGSHPKPASRPTPLPEDLKVFSCQLEAHGSGSPAEAVLLAKSLRIHLWGAKNAKPGWIDAARRIAAQQQVPVTFFTSDEEYGTWVDLPGLGTVSHTSDIFAPVGAKIGPSLADAGVVSWPEYRIRRLKPLEAAGGRVFWQFGENEELCRLLLDDSVERGGFAAISTFHFGNPDFTISEPFLKRYRGVLPFVSIHDAHGDEPWWWADRTAGYRTLFLARTSDWDGWLSALENNWVAAVRHDPVTGNELRMHSGSDAVQQYLLDRSAEWRWWDNPAIARPLVSLVAVKPGDQFEEAAPETGINLRVRLAWETVPRRPPNRPLAELVSLTVDGQTVSPERVGPAERRNDKADPYVLWRMPNIGAGEHIATVTAREIATGREVQQTIRFTGEA